MAEQWEYQSVFVTWDGKAGKWTDSKSQGQLYELLDRQGANGWELVNVEAHAWSGNINGQSVDTYACFYKRRKP